MKERLPDGTQITDAWGDKCTIVGFREGYPLPCPQEGYTHTQDWYWVERDRDNATLGLHPTKVKLPLDKKM